MYLILHFYIRLFSSQLAIVTTIHMIFFVILKIHGKLILRDIGLPTKTNGGHLGLLPVAMVNKIFGEHS